MVLDVDGVVLKGQLLVTLSRRIGIGAFLTTLWNCARYDFERISLEELLDSVYGQLKGKDISLVRQVYESMKLRDGAAEAVRRLRASGRKVVLASAGVPDFVIADLVTRLGADGGAGMKLEARNGRLTGGVTGELALTGGKLAYIERLLEDEGMRWEDAVVVGDDRNNLAAMKKAGMSIGYRPFYQVRKAAQYVVDETSLSRVAELVLGPVPSSDDPAPERHHPVMRKPWHKELRRKAVHVMAAMLPLLGLHYPPAVPIILIAATALFLLSEAFRLNGIRFPIVTQITESVIREHERKELALAPLTLVLGICVALVAFEAHVASACILIVAFGDSAAAVVGERWGSIPIPYSRAKTLEGTSAFLVMSVVCGMVFLAPALALIAGVVAAFAESLALEDWDNFLVPVAAGVAIQAAQMFI